MKIKLKWFLVLLLGITLIFGIGCRKRSERVSKSDYQVANFYFTQAEKYIQKGELKIAAKYIEKGLNLNPYAKKEYLKLATIYKTLGDKLAAVETLKRLVKIAPESKEARLARRAIKKIIISVRTKLIFD